MQRNRNLERRPESLRRESEPHSPPEAAARRGSRRGHNTVKSPIEPQV